MIGILCNSRKERAIAEYFLNAANTGNEKNAVPVIVFSISNINLLEKTVYGSLVSDNKILSTKTSLPLLVFNLSIQHTRSEMKKLRSLAEVEGMFLVNAANNYSQWPIMDMLLTGNKTRSYIMPYATYSRDDVNFDFSEIGRFLLKPMKRASLSRIIYGRQSSYGFDVYSIYGAQSFHRLDIQNSINAMMKEPEYLMLKTPDLITYRSGLLIIRVYLQRRFDGTWEILSKFAIPRNDDVNEIPGKKIDNASLQIAAYVNCFIPSLGICFIDFVLDKHGDPFFLNLGGFDNKLTAGKRNAALFAALCKNILEYAENLTDGKPDNPFE